MALCDEFVYIPQHGRGTASLNVATAAALVLHHYALQAELPERSFTGHKFDVAAIGPVEVDEKQQEAVAEARRARRAEADEGGDASVALASALFGDDE